MQYKRLSLDKPHVVEDESTFIDNKITAIINNPTCINQCDVELVEAIVLKSDENKRFIEYLEYSKFKKLFDKHPDLLFYANDRVVMRIRSPQTIKRLKSLIKRNLNLALNKSALFKINPKGPKGNSKICKELVNKLVKTIKNQTSAPQIPRETLLAIISCRPEIIKDYSEILNDTEFICKALKQNKNVYLYLSADNKENETIKILYNQLDKRDFEYKEVLLSEISLNPEMIVDVAEELEDIDFACKALKQNIGVYKFFPACIRENRQVDSLYDELTISDKALLDKVSSNPELILNYREKQKDIGLVCEALKRNRCIYDYLNHDIANNQHVKTLYENLPKTSLGLESVDSEFEVLNLITNGLPLFF